jgi:RNA polymerase sigma-70 factor (ECF subfamily)
MENEIRSRLSAIGTVDQTGRNAEILFRAAPPAGAPTRPSGNSVPQQDQPLVCAAQSGCRQAFDELTNLYSSRVYRTILAITKNAEDAEDAMQDTFLRAFLAIDRFEGRASFYSWLTRIAINSALMILRRRRSVHEVSFSSSPDWGGESLPMEVTDSAADPEEACSQQQRRDILIRAIHKLKPSLREAVRARLEEECSVKEIAERCNISEAAAKSRLLRARTRLGRVCTSNFASLARRQSLRADLTE